MVPVLCVSVLLATIEPGLMDEPCDWDVCTEASTPDPLSQMFSRREKNKHIKSEVHVSGSMRDEPFKHSSERKPQKTHQAHRPEAHGEGNPKKVSSVMDAVPQSPPQAVPTRKELQDSLPKIPPLSSFKSCRSRFMTFEEVQWDFQSFITTGLGRSVEVIREFRGRENDGPSDQNVHRESVTLGDDGAQCLTQNGERWKSNLPHPRSVSSSSSSTGSQSDMEESQPDDETERSEKVRTTRSKVCVSSPSKTHQTRCGSNARPSSQAERCEPVANVRRSREPNRTASAQTSRNESRKMKEETGKKMKRDHERSKDEGEENDDEENDEEEEEGSAETYWRACYRAWNDYYQEQGYQSYYSVAHNWMAAYRMNAVYMEELMKH